MDMDQFEERAAIAAVLDYEPAIGKLFWKHRDASWFRDGKDGAQRNANKWNARFAGCEALTADNGQGYRVGLIFGRQRMAHRVAWLLGYGDWPAGEVDHINGDRSDNRLTNLRTVSAVENMRNRKRPATNQSGAIGVRWIKSRNKWRADIKVDGVSRFIGHFASFEDAVAARKSAHSNFGFHENHGRSS